MLLPVRFVWASPDCCRCGAGGSTGGGGDQGHGPDRDGTGRVDT